MLCLSASLSFLLPVFLLLLQWLTDGQCRLVGHAAPRQDKWPAWEPFTWCNIWDKLVYKKEICSYTYFVESDEQCSARSFLLCILSTPWYFMAVVSILAVMYVLGLVCKFWGDNDEEPEKMHNRLYRLVTWPSLEQRVHKCYFILFRTTCSALWKWGRVRCRGGEQLSTPLAYQ